MDSRSPFLHERLDVYRFALNFYQHVKVIRKQLPRGLGPLGDQISRAASSIGLNIAEGAAARSRNVKRRHWEIALGSAAECSAALDAIQIEEAADSSRLTQARAQLKETVVRLLGLMR